MSARTKPTLEALIAALTSNCGDMYDACQQTRVSPLWVERWRKDDPEVHEQLAEATRVGAMGLESEAIRRAVKGVDKAVYFKGEVCGYDRVYSDGLLQTVLKARVPQYAAGEGAGNTFNGPTQINIMPRAANYQEWLAMREATDNRKSLPAPVSTIEAEFTEVPSPQFMGLGL